MTQKPARLLTRAELIQGLKDHARKNYSKPGAGWDFVIETMTDADIDGIIGVRTKSVLGAVQMMVQMGGIREMAEQRDAVRAESGEYDIEGECEDVTESQGTDAWVPGMQLRLAAPVPPVKAKKSRKKAA